MKTSASSLAIFGLLALGPIAVSAKCFKSGANWDDNGAARDAVTTACRGGAFAGNFAAGEVKKHCVQHDGNKNFAFEITNLNTNQGFDLNDDDCVNGLWMEIDNCGHGGSTDRSGWRFRSDPNNGKC